MGTQSVSDSTFETDVLGSSTPVLVDFWAEWCGPCRGLAPKLEEISNELGTKIRIVKMNIDENPGTPAKLGIRSIPTLMVFKQGQMVDQLLGNVPKDNIVSMIQKHI